MRLVELRTVLIVFTLCFSASAYSQVCEGDVTLSTQAQVNTFPCVEVTGDLHISDIIELQNVNGLSSLTAVGGDLLMDRNYSFTNLDGLSSLTSVGGKLSFEFNVRLTNLDGLSSLTSVGGCLHIIANGLANIDGLKSLEFVGGDLEISSQDALANLDGLTSLTTVGGHLHIMANGLANLDGLTSLTTVGGHLHIMANGLANIDGLKSLEFVGGDLEIYLEPALANLDGLSSLKTVAGWVFIGTNGSLTNLNGLASLRTVGQDFAIDDNDSLTNIDGLSSLASVGRDLAITDNDLLSECTCGLWALLNDGGVEGSIIIKNNAPWPGCNSLEQVLQGTCGSTLSEKEMIVSEGLKLHAAYPNPFYTSTMISYTLSVASPIRLAVYDILGKTVSVLERKSAAPGQYQVTFNASHLPPGLYTVQLEQEDKIRSERIILAK